ncbi:MAG: 16S rRNA (cytosine(1402)-N(4))-methyltransferase RsmH [Candidatus Abyssobacteria bacterium SURF_5]|uniref:Ribosomal RNA small subunit methyltransferase H n=1 Tax=Abyssobacteria bacterium (strain SURF_5) TaxID=2093360 RepID=A0A3A4P1Y3_ABYX5|nr:MAG: 16S rRNA (cytosine(1402)-N(4))-methyltransferase RsmH [Candidatus Abyssubacteria bacterium SURF_5]
MPFTHNNDLQPVHVPVLAESAVSLLACSPGKIIVDATVGGGGHAQLILDRLGGEGMLVGLDRDAAALEIARRRLGPRPNVILVHENFSHLAQVLDDLNLPAMDALLLDLGLSSFQVDDPERGFSFKKEGPLDMRMDSRQKISAWHIVNTYSEQQIADILHRFGEEPNARNIAKAMVRERVHTPIQTTTRLAKIIQDAVRWRRPSRIDPATRSFQALRIAVNSELEHLQAGLNAGIGRLKAGGRISVISFHSLEDRIVKRTFRRFARGCICPPDLPQCVCGKKPTLKILTPKPVEPSPEEVSANPRSRSARLRAAEKISEDSK